MTRSFVAVGGPCNEELLEVGDTVNEVRIAVPNRGPFAVTSGEYSEPDLDVAIYRLQRLRGSGTQRRYFIYCGRAR